MKPLPSNGRGKALAFIRAEHAAGRPFPKRADLAVATGLKQTAVADLLDALLIGGYLKRGERAQDGRRAYVWELVESSDHDHSPAEASA